jgi:long-subunit fatty acid transport protein
MWRGVTGGVLLILALATCSWGYTFLDLGLGSETFAGSGRCAGMGEVGLLLEETPFAVAGNPALLAGLDRPEIAGSYRFYSIDEDWSFPAHDSFDALLGYTTYSRNSNLYNSGAVGVCSGMVPQVLGISFGCAYVPAYDFKYDFHEEVRDRSTSSVPTDKVIAEAFVEGSGDIRSLAFGLGKAVGDRLSVGAGVDYLSGDFDIEGRLSDVDTSKVQCWDEPRTETSDTFTSSNLDGIRMRVGGTYKINQRVDVAASVVSACELKGDYSTSSDAGLLEFLPRKTDEDGTFKVKYPASYALGVTFRPRNELLTVIEADVRYTEWSDADNQALESLSLDDIYEWHIGVEHVFYNQQALRFGFTYKGSPVDDKISDAAFTVGSGFAAYGFAIEASARVGWREYRHSDLFDDSLFCAESRDFADLVEETSFSGMISITRGL